MTTRESLLKSIDKWDKICFEGGADLADVNCSLCFKFPGNHCEGCPVNDVSLFGCRNTPYLNWHDLGVATVRDEESFDAALQEYFFLCMLYHEYYGD